MTIRSVNPATGEVLAEFDALTGEQLESKLALAATVFREHRRTNFARRWERMKRAAEILDEKQREFGTLITREMGKPIEAAVAEVVKCARVARFYADNGGMFLREEDVPTDAAKSYVRYEPLGPVLAVMPWNFPFWQVFRFAAPAVMAGNVALLKHASNVPQCALAIEQVFRDAGFEEGVFQTLLVGSDAVGDVIADERVRAVTLTGSEPAGSEVAARAGKAIKKSVLELGGSDPFIVTPSADLDYAVEIAVRARTINNGQSCIAAKRFIVFEQIAEEFERLFVSAMNKLKVGNPMDKATDIGPLATEKIADDLERQVRESVDAGATLLAGGRRMRDLGPNYFEPTVLSAIPKASPAWGEEMFGPVASIFRVGDIDEAIALANDTAFGLGASAWTTEEKEQQRFIEEIEAGQVFINAMVASDPRLPFGGIKHSGYGRELSVFGIREFVNIKTVWVAAKPGPQSKTE